MRALVFSDSHGRVQPMLDAMDLYRPDVWFHLGDVVKDGEKVSAAYPDIPSYRVAGNCDLFAPDYPAENIVRLAGKTILYLHGHTAQVKLGVGPAVARAEGIQADLLLFGHTHCPLCRRYDRLLAVNPGAVQDRRAALLTWEPGEEIQCIPLEL